MVEEGEQFQAPEMAKPDNMPHRSRYEALDVAQNAHADSAVYVSMLPASACPVEAVQLYRPVTEQAVLPQFDSLRLVCTAARLSA